MRRYWKQTLAETLTLLVKKTRKYKIIVESFEKIFTLLSMDKERFEINSKGEIPERSKGTVCKTVGTAFAGSNPALATSLG